MAPDVADGTYRAVDANVAAGDRDVLRKVVDELKVAGYELRGNAMVNVATGTPFAFEILVTTKEDERLALAYQRVVERIGIAITVRTVDATQYQLRRKTFDFDMVRNSWSSSLSPGNEQINRWSPEVADAQGSFNLPGAREPAIDALIQAMVAAPTHDEFVTAVRAYDRVLISGFYVVPLFYLPNQWSHTGAASSIPTGRRSPAMPYLRGG